MRYLYYEDKYFNGLLNLWNEEAEIRGFYKPFTPESFRAHVINHPDFADSASFIALDGEEVVGFVCGIVKKADITDLSKPGYLTAILVKSTHRRRGIGAKLLEMCELDLRRKGRKAIRVVFLSNMNWPWYIPDTDKHDHPRTGCTGQFSGILFLLHHKFDVQGFAMPSICRSTNTKHRRTFTKNESKFRKRLFHRFIRSQCSLRFGRILRQYSKRSF